MEGVVLYVTLVKVFVHNHKYYIIGFTVASYGMLAQLIMFSWWEMFIIYAKWIVIPAIYMASAVPIGFLVEVDNITDHTHYLYYRRNKLTA